MVGRVVGGRGCEILAVWRWGLDWESRNVRYGMGEDLCRSADQRDMVSNSVYDSAPVLPGLCSYLKIMQILNSVVQAQGSGIACLPFLEAVVLL